MKLEKFEVPGLAHYSYIISSQGAAAVVDPQRDVAPYMHYARRHGLTLRYVLETHIHADYASGALELARLSGAELWLSGHDEGEDYAYQFPHHEFRDGETLEFGEVSLRALHTPGHTPEHLSFLVYDRTRSQEQAVAILSGDFVLVGSLGRPDLLGEAAKRRLAGALYASVHEGLAGLQDGVEVHPAHGAGTLCGSGVGERDASTLGYERAGNPYFQSMPRETFISRILATVPPFPDYYRRMKRLNSDGPPAMGSFSGNRPLGLGEFRVAMEQAVVVDLRRPEAFGGAHIAGAFNIGAGQNLSMWAAWMLPADRDLVLVGEETTDMGEAVRALARVGLDRVRGSLEGGMRTWIEAGLPLAHTPQMAVGELHACQRHARAGVFVLDVRSNEEWKHGHIAGATHQMAGELAGHLGDLPRDRTLYVVCGSGYRSSVAISLLQREGFTDLVNVVGGMGAWNAQRLPVTIGTEPTPPAPSVAQCC